MRGLMQETHCAKDIDRANEDELASYLAECAAELAASGLSWEEALAEAHRCFGDISAYIAACRREAPHERFPSLNHCLRTIQRARSSTALQPAIICTRLLVGGFLITLACLMGTVAISPTMHHGVAWTTYAERLQGMLPDELLFRIRAHSWPLWSFIGAIHAPAGALMLTVLVAECLLRAHLYLQLATCVGIGTVGLLLPGLGLGRRPVSACRNGAGAASPSASPRASALTGADAATPRTVTLFF